MKASTQNIFSTFLHTYIQSNGQNWKTGMTMFSTAVIRKPFSDFSVDPHVIHILGEVNVSNLFDSKYLSVALQSPVHAWTLPEDPTGVLHWEKGKIGYRL